MSITSGAYLAHHGILGQKWGKKNGPPYPLNYSDLSSAEREQRKSEAISKGNVVEANANKQWFSDKELNDVINRFNIEQRISQIAAEQIKTGEQKVDEIMRRVGKMRDWTEKSISAYNTIAKIYNTFAETDDDEIVVIGQPKRKKDEPKKDKNYDEAIITQKAIEDMYLHPDKYTQKELAEAAKRIENVGKLGGKNKN